MSPNAAYRLGRFMPVAADKIVERGRRIAVLPERLGGFGERAFGIVLPRPAAGRVRQPSSAGVWIPPLIFFVPFRKKSLTAPNLCETVQKSKGDVRKGDDEWTCISHRWPVRWRAGSRFTKPAPGMCNSSRSTPKTKRTMAGANYFEIYPLGLVPHLRLEDGSP